MEEPLQETATLLGRPVDSHTSAATDLLNAGLHPAAANAPPGAAISSFNASVAAQSAPSHALVAQSPRTHLPEQNGNFQSLLCHLADDLHDLLKGIAQQGESTPRNMDLSSELNRCRAAVATLKVDVETQTVQPVSADGQLRHDTNREAAHCAHFQDGLDRPDELGAALDILFSEHKKSVMQLVNGASPGVIFKDSSAETYVAAANYNQLQQQAGMDCYQVLPEHQELAMLQEFADGRYLRMNDVPDEAAPGRALVASSDMEGAESGFEPRASELCRSVSEKQRRLKEVLNPPKYDVSQLYYEHGLFQSIATSPYFENATMLVVLINAFWIAIDLDLNKPADGEDSDTVFKVADQTFCFLFTGELVVRFLATEHKCRLFIDGWFLFDFTLVSLMVLETWVMPIIMAIIGVGSDSALSKASVLRLLRLLRVTRMAKAMRAMPELMVMIKGMAVGIRSVAASMILLLGITYLFAVLFRQLAAGTEVGNETFPTVPMSLYSLLLESMLPDNGDTMTALGGEQWYLGLLFFMFLVMATLTILNMLIGVMCDVMTSGSESRKDANELDAFSGKLWDLILRNDPKFKERVNKEEFDQIMSMDNALILLEEENVDVHTLVESADSIFLRTPEQQGFSFAEFVELVWQFRSTQRATNRAVAGLRDLVDNSMRVVSNRLEVIELMLRDGTRGQQAASSIGSVATASPN